MSSLSGKPVLVCHDLLPGVSPVRAMLRRLADGDVPAIEGGSRLKPLGNDVLLRQVGRHPGARVFVARNAQPVRAAPGIDQIRSLVPLAHPVLLVLRQFEQRLAGQGGEAGLVAALAAEPPRYPFASLQAGFYSAYGQKAPRGRPILAEEAIRLAEDLHAPVAFALGDFPLLLEAGLRAGLDAAGIASRPSDAAGPEAEPALLLAAWRERLPADLFRRLCDINAGDLAFIDAVLRLHGDRLGLDAGQRAAAEEALGRSAEITGHRRAESVEQARVAALYVARPASLIEADPELGWRNRRHARDEMLVHDRKVLLDTDGFGCRPVHGRPEVGERTLAIYGCSHTFGWGVPSEETYASVLQAALPTWRVENHSAYAYGTVHNLLELRRNLRWERPDYVTFGWAAEHRLRNVADTRFVLSRTPRPSKELGKDAPKPIFEMTPRALFDGDGNLVFRNVTLPRPDLVDVDLADFAPDPYYMDQVCFRLLADAAALVSGVGGQFFVTVLLNALSPPLARWLDEAGIAVVQASLPSKEYTNLPFDHHPNPAGHRFYAARIGEYLATLEPGLTAARIQAGA